ncbi:MAG: hypothetical protein KKA62_02845 [Nanoarchaeota archaeon]|nr:hypothetical protein [Nanoarchaeota archaeon]MBU1644107.1 hypothetical protein [Nanoarchaeota archaeon]MBU1976869.1 hypothetical protein [Nanoarchaeota archaeon]
MESKKIIASIVLLIFLAQAVLALGSISTGSLTPVTLDLCGSHSSKGTLTAQNILNLEAVDLIDVSASLILPESSGLTIKTKKTVPLGNISAAGTSSLNPSWEIECNSNKPGEYIAYIKYDSANDFSASSAGEIYSNVVVNPVEDVEPPQVVNYSLQTTNIPSTMLLQLNTNENATCKYDKTKFIDYDQMSSTFSVTGSKNHQETLYNLVVGVNSFYVRCMDIYNNKAQTDYELLVELNAPPTAEIELSDPSPVKAGTILVNLKTSKNVQSPSLKYAFGNTSSTNIVLFGSGTTWQGYMSIGNSEGNKIGYFDFSATDMNGKTGTEITKGKIFLVDTVPPEAPTLVTAVREDGKVILSWFHNGVDIDHYNIYRSTIANSGGIAYKSSSEKTVLDNAINLGKTYYYKLSAVDTAGNEGAFSTEVNITIEDEKKLLLEETVVNSTNVTSNSTTATTNTSVTTVVEEIEDTASWTEKVNNHLESVTDLLDESQKKIDDFKKNIPEEVLLSEINNVFKDQKAELTKLKNNLGNLLGKDAGVMKKGVEEYLKSLSDLKKGMVSSVKKENQNKFQLGIKESDISALAEKYLNKIFSDKTDKEIEKYLSKIIKFNSEIAVEAEVTPVTITYLNGGDKTVYLVTKKITLGNTEITDALLLENIPKDVVSNFKEIGLDKTLKSIESDLLLTAELGSAKEFEYSYLVKEEVKPEDFKETVTLLLPNFKAFKDGTGSSNFLTGFSIADTFSGLTSDLSFYDILLALGTVLIVGLLFSHLISLKKKKEANLHKESGAPPKIKNDSSNESSLKEKALTKLKPVLDKIKDLTKMFEKGGEQKPFPSSFVSSSSPPPFSNPLSLNRSKVISSPQPGPSNGQVSYSKCAPKEYKEAGLVRLKDTAFSILFDEAEQHINNFDFDRAVKPYYALLANQETVTSLRGKVDPSIKVKMPRLHKKLCVLVKINQLHQCRGRNDLLNMKYLLNDVANIYNELLEEDFSEDRLFLQKVEHYHGGYSQLLLKRS